MGGMDYSDLYALTIEAARDPITGVVDSGMIEPMMNIVRKDSGVQIVYGDIEHALERAKRFKEPFRSLAIAMAKADKKSLKSISSESGAYMREFNTSRSTIPIGGNEGPTYTEADRVLNEDILGKGKGFFKHNKKSSGSGIDFN